MSWRTHTLLGMVLFTAVPCCQTFSFNFFQNHELSKPPDSGGASDVSFRILDDDMHSVSARKSDSRIRAQGSHFVKDGHRVFLSGANTAWVHYGKDFGNHQYQNSRDRFLHKLDMVSNAGGNSMRTWVHIHGATSPHFDSTGHVTGLDSDGSFLSDFMQYLDDAHARNVLVFPTLWNGAVLVKPELLQGLITDTSKLQSYIDNALIPWVKAVKDHPALGGWDIINEFEGFINPDIHDSEPCFDTTFLHGSGAGWAGKLYTAHDLLRFINWQTEAIRRVDPEALVTAGSWSQHSQTDRMGFKNLYSDHCLTKTGGKANGTLTFYSTHSYDWHGAFENEAVFKHSYDSYRLDKPLVVAEFMERRGGGMTAAQMFTYVYNHGYAGAWHWPGESEDVAVAGIRALNGSSGNGGLVNFSL